MSLRQNLKTNSYGRNHPAIFFQTCLSRHSSFTLNEYGKTTLKKLTEEFITITKRLSSYPTSFPEERLLKNMPYKYRSIIFRKNFKIIYRYEDETNTILLIDIWDMRMDSKNIIKNFKQ